MHINRRTFLQSTTALALAGAESAIDLTDAAIVLSLNPSPRIRNYATLLREESEKRTRMLWRSPSGPSRIVLSAGNSNSDEGFTISSSASEVRIDGHSERGLLYGIGYLLRNVEFSPGRALLPRERAAVSSTPHYSLRGHQLGYRPKTNSYDGWDVADWHQYIRDLAIFGINAIEILPPRTDDDATSPHFPLPPEQMMVEVSQLADNYGLDVWIWFPALDNDYTAPDKVAASLKEWATVFEKLPRLNAVFTPGGDPGDTSPAILLSLLQQQKDNLRRFHPTATMWVSPQSFNEKQLPEFLAAANSAEWLDGVVHGPQCRIALPELRKRLRKDLPIRLYPDITHSLQCQFPVPDWDRSLAATEGRECINPRPEGFAAIARQYLAPTIGFISYSEGCNDDVNKFIWSCAAWDPDFNVDTCLQDYARYFIGASQCRDFAAGLKALEQNWRAPYTSANQTLVLFQQMENAAAPETLRNWRFQQALYRAYFDAYTRRRLAGSADETLRTRILELAEALFQSIHMQLDVERYKAEAVGRGANLDTLDANLSGPSHYMKTGQGSYHDDLGDLHNRPHLHMPPLSAPDPEFRHSVLLGFLYPDSLGPQYPVAWKRWGETLFDTPLTLRYTGLDPAASYKVKVVYSGDAHRIKVRLVANEIEIHPFIPKPWPPKPLEFDVPREVTSKGTATFSWTRESGLGGGGRGCQLSEVWLIRQ